MIAASRIVCLVYGNVMHIEFHKYLRIHTIGDMLPNRLQYETHINTFYYIDRLDAEERI